MTPQQTAHEFVAAINAHDVERLVRLMTADHRFVDSLGTVTQGRESMREGWTFYFAMVPDYHLEMSGVFNAEASPDETILVGQASGSYCLGGTKRANSGWSTPVALRAVVRNGQIAQWQVYADNEPMRQQMRAPSA
jgi:ketosteroid isomerase-like protein